MHMKSYMAKKNLFPKSRNGFSYSVLLIVELGCQPVVVDGVTYDCVLAEVKTSDISMDPDNPRLWGSDDKFNPSKAGQTRLAKNLFIKERQVLLLV